MVIGLLLLVEMIRVLELVFIILILGMFLKLRFCAVMFVKALGFARLLMYVTRPTLCCRSCMFTRSLA